MKPEQAVSKFRDYMRLRHLALSTEQGYCAWLVRYMRFLSSAASELESSEAKVEAFLTTLAHQQVSASTQNQAFNALVMFYREVVGKPLVRVDALRANRPQRLREAPSVADTRALLAAVQDVHGYPTRLLTHLIYGCGLRVTEPCNLRVKDVDLAGQRLVIRAAKGNKDRVVALPCSLYAGLRDQLEAARVIWKRDVAAGIPLQLPEALARKYPRSRFAWKWAWVFPQHTTCQHPRTGETVRYRVHEANLQLAIRTASGGDIKPHELRHAYATHSLNRGVNPRAIQQAMGHQSLETTMGYLHAEAMSVSSPLEAFA
jgi:integron integrase